ncbi:MAG: R.HinP1I restriction endonuclease [Acidobacteria bacterium OLB17]|nr:MAG: R.HinP1I restriction endonuclease [Acidobacteria bacterium OLB17]
MSLSRFISRRIAIAFIVLASVTAAFGQSSSAKLGSDTAKGGFRNEDAIRDKFNAFRTDDDAKAWLRAMGYDPAAIVSLAASKPHGEKADVEIVIETAKGKTREGISIKLVSGQRGFNQIDKRRLSHYREMWKMPDEVVAALKLFVGETPPTKPGRSKDRMFLNEIDPQARDAVIKFFSENKERIVSDLFAGDGDHDAGWIMVAFKPSEKRSGSFALRQRRSNSTATAT